MTPRAGEARSGPRRARVWLLRLAFLVGGLVVTIVGVEIAVRTFLPQGLYSLPRGTYEADPQTGYRMIPNHTMVKTTPDYRMVMQTNSRGLRDGEHGDKRGRFRILGLGDSYTFGYGVTPEETYLAHLEKALSACHPGRGVDVVKAGVPGYNTRQELAYLKRDGIAYEPDLVTLGFVINNDTGGNVKPELVVVDGIAMRADGTHPTYGTRPSLGLRLKYYLRSVSHTYVIVADTLKDSLGPALRAVGLAAAAPPVSQAERTEMDGLLRASSPAFDRAWDTTQQILRDMQDFLKARGIPFVIVAIAHDVQYNPVNRRKVMARMGYQESELDLERPSRLLREFAEGERIPILDLFQPFATRAARGQSLRFRFDGHWNSDGHRLAADELFRFLVSRRLAPCGAA